MGSGSSQIELIERLGDTVKELQRLLDLYAPQWYPDELRKKATGTLRLLESASDPSRKRPPGAKVVRGNGHARS